MNPVRSLRWIPMLGLVVLAELPASCSRAPEGEPKSASAAMTPLQRGEYLSKIGGCHDCHTPGGLYGAPDFKRALAGSEVGWQGPWGVTYARNLTPDPETGLGTWTHVEIERALRSGVRKDGSPIGPPMARPSYASFTEDDMASLIAYLKSLPPVRHRVPDRVPLGGTPTTPVISVPVPSAWDMPPQQATAP